MEAIKSVIVVGGGSAGLMSALSLKLKIPELSIKLIKTESIPIIGVGEGTTPQLPKFLHDFLNLDLGKFFKEVKPSWKLGIKYLWGDKPTPHFFYSFDKCLSLKYANLKYNNAFYCLEGYKGGILSYDLMENNKSIMFPIEQNKVRIENIAYGYHIENKLFVEYLEKKCIEEGVEFIDQKIHQSPVEKKIGIQKIVLENGEELSADLYLDCSGFSSILLNKALKEKFISFEDSLFCDSAVTGTWDRKSPEEDPILPYTTAETMNNGWCWRVELRDKVNRGYVFSSKFCSDEEAIAEMKKANPKMKDIHRVIRFKTGRYKRSWVKNVVAIGNSAGFVEPLEATGLHMVQLAIKRLIFSLQDSNLNPGEGIKDIYNNNLATVWDDIRWFLSIHYKLNNKLNTKFWKHCQTKTDSTGVDELLDFYANNGPTALMNDLLPKDSIFGYEGYITMLVHQKLKTKFKTQISEVEQKQLREISARNQAISQSAFSLEKAYSIIDLPQWKWQKEGI